MRLKIESEDRLVDVDKLLSYCDIYWAHIRSILFLENNTHLRFLCLRSGGGLGWVRTLGENHVGDVWTNSVSNFLIRDVVVLQVKP